MGTIASKLLPALGAALLGLAFAVPVQAADSADKGTRRTIQPVPRAPALEARVAQGGVVMLAPSQLRPAELAAMRPNYQALKPRLNNP